jgi:agmatine/peptidylarginine deiminase
MASPHPYRGISTVRALGASALTTVMLFASLAGQAVADDEPGASNAPPPPEASYAPHTPQFLAQNYFAELPRERLNAFRSDPRFTQWPWECDPDFVHDTGPTPPEFLYDGEFDLTNGVLFGISEWVGCFMSDQIELIEASLSSDAEVTILTERKLIPNVERCLRGKGFTRAQIDRINFVPVEVDSMWIRDYGPEFQRHETDHAVRAMVDPTYNSTIPRADNCRPVERGPLTWGRDRDDASPTRLADLVAAGGAELRGVGTATAYRAPVVFEGGNIFTDGEGTCFRNRQVANRMNTAEEFMGLPQGIGQLFRGWWDYGEAEVDDLIAAYYNCDEVVVLDSMLPTTLDVPFGGVIDHIDMSVTFLSPDTVLVGDYNYQNADGEYLTLSGEADEPDDPVNATILDENAALLEAAGYDVVRIPMPVPFCTRGNNCVLDHERDLSAETVIPCPDHVYEDGRYVGGFDPETGAPLIRVWATFANSIRIGDRHMVPSYPGSADALPSSEHGELLAEQEAEALQVYQDELDALYGDVEVVPVTSDGLAPCNGSLQCITKTY